MNTNDSSTMFIIDIPTGGPSTQYQFKSWICHISVPSSSHDDLSISLSHTPPITTDHQRTLDNARLRILSGLLNNAGSLVLEMPFQLSQVLHGLQVHVDPSMVKSWDGRYNFRVLIEIDNNTNNTNGFTCNRQQKPPDPRIVSCLTSSQVSKEAQHRMMEFLERAVNTDVKLSFNSPRTSPCSPGSSSCSPEVSPCSPGASPEHDDVASFPDYSDDSTLNAYLCVLKTVGTTPMQRLLNTYPPNDQVKDINNSTFFDQSNSGSSSNSYNGNNSNINPTEPIREIRFEDSPPAAVEAVVRYIYFGQQPVLEPHCGYTVKDLMSLASYLEIEQLQDHCVQLVLGKSISDGNDSYRPIRTSTTTRTGRFSCSIDGSNRKHQF
ncbi:hypothetical protein BGZ46_007809 [Entomortierella lignicola]|nr:hypothetical protein BGZ46_007809 [Entomortierella lignicola]